MFLNFEGKMKKTIFILILISFLGCKERSIEEIEFIKFQENNLWGYKNDDGKVLIEPTYIYAYDFNEFNLALVSDLKGWKYIDKSGAEIIRPYVIDGSPDTFQEGLARYKHKGKFGFFNQKGKITIYAIFDYVRPFKDSLAAYYQGKIAFKDDDKLDFDDGFWGFIDMTGYEVIPAQFEEVKDFQDGRAKIKLKGDWYTINKRGKIVE